MSRSISPELLLQSLVHELNQPVTGAKAGLTFLRKRLTKEQQESDDYALLVKQIDRMNEITTAFRELLSGGDLMRDTLDVEAVVRQAVDLMSFDLRFSRCTAELEFGPDLSPAEGSPSAVLHTLTNLIKNAIEAAPTEGGRILIQVHQNPTGGTDIRICNNGTAIPPHLRSTLFEAHASSKGRRGRGLGLYISSELLAMSGSTVRLATEDCPEWANTQFVISVPRATAQEAPPEIDDGGYDAARGRGGERPVVLVVDDEVVIAYAVGRALADEGFETVRAHSSAEALGLIAERRFDVILTDKNLGDGAGGDLIRAARAKDPPVGAIMLTGYASLDSGADMLREGIDRYLQKPLDLDILAEHVRSVLRLRFGRTHERPRSSSATAMATVVGTGSWARQVVEALTGGAVKACQVDAMSEVDAGGTMQTIVVRLDELSEEDINTINELRIAHRTLKVVALGDQKRLSMVTRAILIGARGVIQWPPTADLVDDLRKQIA